MPILLTNGLLAGWKPAKSNAGRMCRRSSSCFRSYRPGFLPVVAAVPDLVADRFSEFPERNRHRSEYSHRDCRALPGVVFRPVEAEVELASVDLQDLRRRDYSPD